MRSIDIDFLKTVQQAGRRSLGAKQRVGKKEMKSSILADLASAYVKNSKATPRGKNGPRTTTSGKNFILFI